MEHKETDKNDRQNINDENVIRYTLVRIGVLVAIFLLIYLFAILSKDSMVELGGLVVGMFVYVFWMLFLAIELISLYKKNHMELAKANFKILLVSIFLAILFSIK